MKRQIKLLSVLAVAMGATHTSSAQQLPNPGFEDNWVDCIPWDSANNTTKKGKTPSPWIASQVYAVSGFGTAETGKQVEGHESASAIELTNVNVTGNVVPGYVSLGTSWSTARIQNFSPKECDGGTFGGLDFTYRPDAVGFWYKRTAAGSGDSEANVVVYSWKGTYTQSDVPGNIVLYSLISKKYPTKVTMTDRDRNILGMATDQGGAVSHTPDAACIAKSIAHLPEASDWTETEIPVSYSSSDRPEKFNIIFSAGDYFTAKADVKKNFKLTVDDVRLIYYSRLSSVSIDGIPVDGFDPKTYDYTMPEVLHERADLYDLAETVEASLLSNSGMSGMKTDVEDDAIVITVFNNEGPDYDNLSEHTYRFHYRYVTHTRPFDGTATIDGGSDATDQTVYMDYLNDGTTAIFRCPGLSLISETVVDIMIPDVTISRGDLTSYSGSHAAHPMADGTTAHIGLAATETDDRLTAEISIFRNQPETAAYAADQDAAIKIIFNGTPGIPTAIDRIEDDGREQPATYYRINGTIATEPLAPGLYIRLQGGKASKITVR